MSRFGGGFRSSADDLAYGDSPQRWDRDRLERFGRGPPPPPQPPGPPGRFEEDYHYTERDRPGRHDVMVEDRIEQSGPRGRVDERERERIYRETFGAPPGPRRRTDKELFGEVDPREIAEMAMTPYRRKSVTSRGDLDIDINIRKPEAPRPGLMRRQSSLDTYDRKPMNNPMTRYEPREDYRMPAYTPVPLPIRRREDDFEESRYYDAPPENYREFEVKRERSVHRRSGKAKSAKSAKSVKSSAKSVSTRRSSSSSSSSSSATETISKATSRGESPEPAKKMKKGKTRMPKRLVHHDAIQDLGYPYEEEEDFYVLKVALKKEEIDEVIKISEMYKSGENRKVYRFEEEVHEEAPSSHHTSRAPSHAPTRAPSHAPPYGMHEEIIHKEYINPPSNFGGRTGSPSANSSVSRRLSPARTAHTTRTRGRSMVEERKTVIDERSERGPPPPSTYERSERGLPAPSHYERSERGPPPPPSTYYPPPMSVRGPPPSGPEFFEERRTIIEERAPPPSHHGALIVQERDYRSDRDIQSEIRALEAERKALRTERERPSEEEFQLVEYRREQSRPRREVLEIVEREQSPERKVVRVEKDRKEHHRRRRKSRNAKVVAAAVATLT